MPTHKEKTDKKIHPAATALLGTTWFIFVSYFTALTEYQLAVADALGDPMGTSTSLENLLSIAVVIISFIPASLLIASSLLAKQAFKSSSVKVATLLVVTSVVTVTLWFLFICYNFAINHP